MIKRYFVNTTDKGKYKYYIDLGHKPIRLYIYSALLTNRQYLLLPKANTILTKIDEDQYLIERKNGLYTFAIYIYGGMLGKADIIGYYPQPVVKFTYNIIDESDKSQSIVSLVTVNKPTITVSFTRNGRLLPDKISSNSFIMQLNGKTHWLD